MERMLGAQVGSSFTRLESLFVALQSIVFKTQGTFSIMVVEIVIDGFFGTSQNNIVEANYIGTDPTGLIDLGNSDVGIKIGFGSTGNRIGGNTAGHGNLISGNQLDGIEIASQGNLVVGNLIGLASNGSVLGNNNFGISIHDSNNTIGTSASINVISGNGLGGIAIGSNRINNTIIGNRIGTTPNGLTARPNQGNGIQILPSITPSSTRIGGPLAGEGNLIAGNTGNGILVQTNAQVVVQGNVIGLNSNGFAIGNQQNGILLSQTGNNLIGTDGNGSNDATEGNTISGNGQSGIRIVGAASSNNTVAGNKIGMTPDGLTSRGNSAHGVSIVGSNNIVLGNYVSGNGSHGVLIAGSGTNDNRVSGNIIGLNADGTAPVGNIGNGVLVDAGALRTIVGTNGDGIDDASERNIISGNQAGIVVTGNTTQQTAIAGNWIGLLANGTSAVGNNTAGDGIALTVGTTLNRVGTNADGISDVLERNTIAGHNFTGIAIYNASTSNNIVSGNWIGLNAVGTATLANGTGIAFSYASAGVGPSNNRIGTNADGVRDNVERNVISGNGNGVVLSDSGTSGNVIAGNYIGTDPTGTLDFGNSGSGVVIGDLTSNNTIGGSSPSSKNLISGNNSRGVLVGNATDISISGNWIGTDATGISAIPNGVGITANSSPSLSIAGNLVSGNGGHGMFLTTAAGPDVLYDLEVVSNRIGLNVNGDALGNTGSGITVTSPTVNASTKIDNNVISSNNQHGIFTNGAFIEITANTIGLDPTGSKERGNRLHGIFGSTGLIDAPYIIGVADYGIDSPLHEFQANTISANGGAGISINGTVVNAQVRGNRIGTDRTGTIALGNGRFSSVSAISIQKGSIGTNGNGVSDSLERNIISGNLRDGILLQTGSITGNWIGVDATGTNALPNQGNGVVVPQTTLGSVVIGNSNSNPLLSNVIASNGQAGLLLRGNDTTVVGNFIGTDRSGSIALGNGTHGVLVSPISASFGIGNVIGGLGTLANTISSNLQAGIRIEENFPQNTIDQNRYFGNGTLGVDVGSIGVTPNTNTASTTSENFPVMTDAYVQGAELVIRGLAKPGITADLYLAVPNVTGFGEGSQWLGRFIEGSAGDLLSTTGSYTNADFSGLNVASGTVSANRFEFRMPLPDGVQFGSRLTMIHVGQSSESVRVSEFSNSIYIGDAPGFTIPGSSLPAVISLPGLTSIAQGESLRIEGAFVDYDSTEWTAKINYGDGTIENLPLREDFTFAATHIYRLAGNFTVTVTIVDNALRPSTATMPVVVTNVAPEVDLNLIRVTSPVNEGNAVTLTGQLQDGVNSESHEVHISWGDGTPIQAFTLGAGVTAFSATRTYNSRGAGSLAGAGVDFYSILATVVDPANASDSTPLGLVIAEVRNVLPTALNATFSSTTITEGQSISITDGSFTDPGLQDFHKVRVDWGDGSPLTLINLPIGSRSFTIPAHQYLSTPRVGSTYDVRLELIDSDQPNQPLVLTRSITVNPVPASNIVLTTNANVINEGGLILLSGSFTDPNLTQPHRVQIDWGDGSSITGITVPAGSSAFNGIEHIYKDNPATETNFTINVRILDGSNDSIAATATKTVAVTNTAPTLLNLGYEGQANEGDTVGFYGQVDDFGIVDTHSITFQWGDGTTTTSRVVRTNNSFFVKHTFVDQSTQVVMTVTDDEGMSSSQTLAVSIGNSTPNVRILPSANNTNPNLLDLLSKVEDAPGDTVTYLWTAQVLGNASIPVQTGTGANFTVDRSAAPNAVWTVDLDVEDGDGATGNEQISLLAGTAGPDSLSINDTTFLSVPSGTLMVLGLAGQDTIDASGVTNSAFHLILDGGADTDILYGGAGDDLIFLRGGNDTANAGGMPANATNAQLGHDRYMLVPNSTLTVIDTSGDNVLDFGLANFGVTFDLSLSNSVSLVQQDVAPVSDTGLHFVSTQGNFPELIGSIYSDNLTAASASTVRGGTGADQFSVKSGTAGATIQGGADDDTLVATGINLDDISFAGDEGADRLENLATILGLTFEGGADDDVLVNNGFIVESLSFGGDDGADRLENFGQIDSLNFTGGADDDVLENRGAITDTLSFDGDLGADLLANFATIESLSFSGGADDDVLRNEGSVETLNFDGDIGSDTLENIANVVSLGFSGGADNDYLVNHANIDSLNFNGDNGVDTLTNDGEIALTLTFNGGADDDVLVNNATIAELIFVGGADDDTLRNEEGSIDTLSFNGDQGADLLENLATIDRLTFNGGADDDLLVNRADITTSLSFDGDAGVDRLINEADMAGLMFNGGADDDYLVNLEGTITTLSFDGDLGADVLENRAELLGSLTFNGGADDDLLVNSGSIDSITFEGGADDDTLVNQALGLIDTLLFNGDGGSDLLVNNSAIDAITFNGGADDDVLVNHGSVATELSFDGDGGADLLVNDGGFVLTLSFNGDEGADQLVNLADVNSLSFDGDAGEDLLRNEGIVDSIEFTGGADDDTLTNLAVVDSITFTGGADDDYLFNRGSIEGTLSFDGDQGVDVLINIADSTSQLIFTGGADDDFLVNQSTVLERLTFTGGADDDTLVQRGDIVGVIAFDGDDSANPLVVGGNDTLVVHGRGVEPVVPFVIATVAFNGGNGRDVFQNNAANILGYFLGGSGDDVFQNFGTKSALEFTGDLGSDILDNNASDVISISFDGGADSDYLLNEGTSVDTITFLGGADDDFLINVGSHVDSIDFRGEAGVDTLTNNGVEIDSIIFDGGADSDVLLNSGRLIESISFTGGVGADRLWNRATAERVGSIEFLGNADNDTLINQAADIVSLSFDGDAGIDELQNSGLGVDSIVFRGGADDDRLINLGSEIDALTFDGGADDDALLNAGNDISTLSFDGDLGADTLQNNGSSIDAIDFAGGADDDFLLNNGTVIDSIDFNGDDGADVLQNNGLLVESIDFDGGADDDILQNNGIVLAIDFTGGADDDRLLNNGTFVDSLSFDGDSGSDSLIQKGKRVGSVNFIGGTGGDIVRVNSQVDKNVYIDGGSGADSFVYEGYGAASVTTAVTAAFIGGDGNDLLAWLNRGQLVNLSAYGESGDDIFTVAGTGKLLLDGGLGDDYFVLQGAPSANVVIGETFDVAGDTSRDTLNFSTFNDGEINLDLRSISQQPQGASLTITLTDGMGIENVVGTFGGDQILGNARNNVITGAEYLTPEAYPVAARRTQTQWVYLDFDSKTGLGEHAYSATERTAIQAELARIYHGPDANENDPTTWWFDVRFTQDASIIAAAFGVHSVADVPSDSYVTIYFNETPDFGRPGGLASEIDLGNRNPGGTAVVQVNGLLGGEVSGADLVDEVAQSLRDTIEGDIKIGARKPVATSENFITLSTKIAAHELGHLLGLRHFDTFGPVGFGVHTTPGASEYNPVYTGPAGAYEAIDHLLGSGASIGTDRFNDLRQLYFGEREAVKLAYAFSQWSDTTAEESSTVHNTLATAQDLSFVQLSVPNTLLAGLNRGKMFGVNMASITGSIALDPATNKSENDYYRFSGRTGEIVTLEVASKTLRDRRYEVDNWIDSILRVTDEAGSLVEWFAGTASSDDDFESSDSYIIDLVLPYTGDYFIEVDTFARAADSPNLQAVIDAIAELESLPNPTPAQIETIERLRDSLNNQDVGDYQLMVYRFAQANPSDDIDVLKGNGGSDLIDGGPGDDYTSSLALSSASDAREGRETSIAIAILDRAASTWNGYVNFGDGSNHLALDLVDPTELEIHHTYANSGNYEVTVELTNDLGITFSKSLTINVANVAPTAVLDLPDSRSYGQSVPVTMLSPNDVSPGDLAKGLRFAFVLNPNDFDSISYNSASFNASTLLNGLSVGTYVIYARIYDFDGAYTEYSDSVQITPLELTITAHAKSKVFGEADPDLTYTLGTLVNGDTTSVVVGSLARTPGENVGSYAINQGTLTAGKNYSTVYIGNTLTITNPATNNPPTVIINMPTDGFMNRASTFTVTALDSDAVDQSGVFTYSVNWGNGTTTTFTGSNTKSVSRTYPRVSANGSFTISVTVTDPRGAVSVATTRSFIVGGWTLMADPINSGKTMLVVVGSQGNDDIRVKVKNDDYFKVKIVNRDDDVRRRGSVNGDVNRILVYGHAGNDRITIEDDIYESTEVWGGAGHDEIKGGSGHDVLLGESGDDKIVGGDGRDIVIGGLGSDRLYGDSHDDILIAGFTLYEANFAVSAPAAFGSVPAMTRQQHRAALEAILAEWTSARSYTTRRQNIMGTGTGPRSNGTNFLKVSNSNMVQNTVFDDGAVDRLWGDSGNDWFFANVLGDLGSVLDDIRDRNGNESQTDLDRWW